MEERYTIVVSSCDKYKDLWDPFFKILEDEWDGVENIPIVLNTESESYKYDGLDIRTFCLFKPDEQVSWTRRLRETLEKIETKYVIMLLDDFFMMGKVKSEEIQKHINWMERNNRISVFSYMETFTPNIKDGRYDGFERRPLVGTYKFNCQAALWRKTRLISYLDHDESAWEWEALGNWRSYRHPFHHFYSYDVNRDYVFPYIYKAEGVNFGGLGLFRGRWYLPYVEPLFEKHGIHMDFSQRGVITDEELSEIIKQGTPHDADKKKAFGSLRRWYGNAKYIITNWSLVRKHFF